MILLDSNIPMYLVGSDRDRKTAVQRILDQLVADRERLVTDAEVLQEILHRYTAIDRTESIRPALDVLLALADEVFPVTSEDVQEASRIVLGSHRLSARDAIHVAVMERRGIARILSLDRGFDTYPGIERLG